MIDLAVLRERVATIVTAAVGAAAAVYSWPPTGSFELPAVVVGQTAWQPGPTYCLDLYTVQVFVVVARPGSDDQATVAELEQLWPSVLVAVRDAIDADQSLGGLCAVADVKRARPIPVVIQQATYPAQSIDIEIHGS